MHRRYRPAFEHLADAVHGRCSDIDDQQSLPVGEEPLPVAGLREPAERLQRLRRRPVHVGGEGVDQHVVGPATPAALRPDDRRGGGGGQRSLRGRAER